MGEKGLLHVVLAFACLLAVAGLLASAELAEADDDGSRIVGIEPPFAGDWHITADTTVTGATLNLSKNVYVYSRVNFVVENSTINIISEPDKPFQYVFRVETAAVMTVINSTLDLNSFAAYGQAALTFQDGSVVRTHGRFIAACLAIFAYDTLFENKAPKVSEPGSRGYNAIFIMDGRVNSECMNVVILNYASGAAQTQPGADGADGTMAQFVSNVTRWVDCLIEVRAGEPGGGGLGLPGVSGGDGGIGGDADTIIQSNYFERTTINVTATNGGNGAGGSDNNQGNAGDGGDGAQGGLSRLAITSPSSLEAYFCTFNVESGDGGSGGNGGTAMNGDGGTGGVGANAGQAILELHSTDDVYIEGSTFLCYGGDGGYGGDFGRHEGTVGDEGIPKPGGDGGMASLSVTSDVNFYIDDTKMLAKGGPGNDGGSGYNQGETGGDGGDGLLRVRMEASVEAAVVDLSVYGGNGGNGGPAISGISGNGGNGGDADLEFTGLLKMEVDVFDIFLYPGNGGKGNSVVWDGAPGLPTFDLETLELYMYDGRINQALDDLSNGARGHLYNCSIDAPLPVLPIGDAEAWTYYPVDIWVVDSADPSKAQPLKDFEVRVVSVSTGAIEALRKTPENGLVSVMLRSFHYTSLAQEYVGAYIVSAISPDGKSGREVRLDVQGPILWPFPFKIVVPKNTHAPDVTGEAPEEGRSYTFSEETRILEAIGFVTDPDESPITNMYVRLYPEGADANNWPRIKLSLSPVKLSQVKEDEYKWGKYFEPEEYQNKWRFFYRFTIIGGDVLFTSNAYVFEVGAYDGAQWGYKFTNLDIKITPKPPKPAPRPWATVSSKAEALTLVEFNGSVMNLEELKQNGVEVKFYAWDYTGDGELDYFSTKDGATFYIYPDVEIDTPLVVIFSVMDTLGRQINVTKEITVYQHYVPEEPFYDKFVRAMPYIIGIVLVVLIVFGVLSVRARRVREEEDESERKRVEEALANIHECPRCGQLLDSKFATCTKCKTEDMLLEAQELVASLKEQGIVALEQEDLLDKALISFEGIDYDTAQMFIKQAIDQAHANKKKYDVTLKELETVEGLIKKLTVKGVVIPDMEMRVYHSRLALTRSDFTGAKEIADTLVADVTRLDAENRKDEIFEAIQKVEREVRTAKALGEIDTVPASRAVEAAKAAFGTQSYVDAEAKVGEVYRLLKDPTWTPEKEREAEEERAKVEEALKISEAETQRIMEAERRRQEELAAVSVAASKEVKVATFAEEERPVEEREVVADKGKVIEHEAVREDVVEAELPPEPSKPPVVAAPPAYETPKPEREPEVAPKPVAVAPAPKPVAAAPAPKPVAAAPAPKPVAATPVPKPVATAPVPRPAPKPVTAAPVPKPAPRPVAGTGAAMPAEKVPCKSCGKQIKPNWKKCPFCGEAQ